MSFVVKQQAFEGPLDLLLDLIEKRKLFINDISLAKVADDYINHIKSLGQFPIADSATFILIASTLLLIKSKSLLPSLDLTEEEQQSIEDLERRLKMYQRIKDLSIHVKNAFGKNIIFAKSYTKHSEPVFSPDESMNLIALLNGIKDVFKSLPQRETLPQVVVKKVMSLEKMIDNLTTRIKTSLKMSFKDFSNFGKEEKVNVIVSFLAMLELVKQGVIHASQEGSHNEIHMENKNLGVPNYM